MDSNPDRVAIRTERGHSTRLAHVDKSIFLPLKIALIAAPPILQLSAGRGSQSRAVDDQRFSSSECEMCPRSVQARLLKDSQIVVSNLLSNEPAPGFEPGGLLITNQLQDNYSITRLQILAVQEKSAPLPRRRVEEAITSTFSSGKIFMYIHMHLPKSLSVKGDGGK